MTRSSAAHEPSMDEILASIRRIIESGDERPEPAATSRVRPERAPHVERLEPDAESAGKVVARLTPEPSPVEAGEAPVTDTLPSEEATMGKSAKSTAPQTEEPSSAAIEIDIAMFGLDEEEDELTARLQDELAKEDMIDWSALTAALTDEADEVTAPDLLATDRSVGDDAREEAVPVPMPSSVVLPALHPAASLVSQEPQQSGSPKETETLESPPLETATGSKVDDGEETATEAPFVAANSDSRRMQEFRAAVLEDLNGESRPATGSLTSGRTGELVGAAFDDLAEAIREGQMRSMEEMAQDLLRPMLQDWLDDNLPKLVERLVREEIERVARGGRR